MREDTRARALAEIQRVAVISRKRGRKLSTNVYNEEKTSAAPSFSYIIRNYGSWQAALDAADVVIGDPKHETALGHIATLKDGDPEANVARHLYDSTRPDGALCGGSLTYRHGSWTQAVDAAADIVRRSNAASESEE